MFFSKKKTQTFVNRCSLVKLFNIQLTYINFDKIVKVF